MAKLSQDNEVDVKFEDQQKINRFARNNARLQDIKEELQLKKKEFENLEDAENELLMVGDDDAAVPYLVGEVFVHCSMDETNGLLEAAKAGLQQEMDALQERAEGHKKILSDLKVQLYAKFGNNINLEADEES